MTSNPNKIMTKINLSLVIFTNFGHIYILTHFGQLTSIKRMCHWLLKYFWKYINLTFFYIKLSVFQSEQRKLFLSTLFSDFTQLQKKIETIKRCNVIFLTELKLYFYSA